MADRARLLFSTGSLYLLDTAQCFELAAQAGFDGIEIMCDERYGTRDPQYLKALSERYDLPVLVAHTPFSPRVPGWRDRTHLGLIQHTLKLAEQLNAETIVVHLPMKVSMGLLLMGERRMMFPWRSDTEDVRRWVLDSLPTQQAATPVRIALENMPRRDYLWSSFDVAHWNSVEAWSSVHQHLTLDTTHWATHHIDPLVPYRAAAGRVAHVHLSNFDGREHRLPHLGFLDLGAFLRALAADDFAGTVSLEVHPDALAFHDADLMLRHLCDSVAFCREHLA